MLAYLFPGQGSQVVGMGKELFAEFPDLMQAADEILGYSLKTLCLTSHDPRLHQTQFTQPALFTVNALSYLKKLKDGAPKPDYALGHSLGEYNALLAAEVFDFATGLRLVKKRGELMSRQTQGAMCAIIGLKIDEIKNSLQTMNFPTIALANHNTYLQSVISGFEPDIERAAAEFKKNNSLKVIPLKVSGAFHSSFMAAAEKEFSDYLRQFEFKTAKIPVLANCNAEFYHPAVVKTNLANQISNSVQWVSMIETLLQQENMTFEEIGPGKVLTGLLKHIRLGN